MFRQIASKLTEIMVKDKMILRQEQEIYLYGLETLIAGIVNTLLIVMIGGLWGYFVETVVFLLCYCPLRQFTGGYHASSYLKCSISFIGIFLLTVWGYHQFREYICAVQMAVILLLSCITIIVLAPVEDEHKPLEAKERKKCKEVATCIMGVEVTVIAILLTGNEFIVRLCVFGTLALAWIAMLLLLGFIKNLNTKKNKGGAANEQSC